MQAGIRSYRGRDALSCCARRGAPGDALDADALASLHITERATQRFWARKRSLRLGIVRVHLCFFMAQTRKLLHGNLMVLLADMCWYAGLRRGRMLLGRAQDSYAHPWDLNRGMAGSEAEVAGYRDLFRKLQKWNLPLCIMCPNFAVVERVCHRPLPLPPGVSACC